LNSSDISRIPKSLQSFLQKRPQFAKRLLLVRRHAPLILNGEWEGKSASTCLYVKAYHHAVAKVNPIGFDALGFDRRHRAIPSVFASAETLSPSA
jgi:hypothetical protein